MVSVLSGGGGDRHLVIVSLPGWGGTVVPWEGMDMWGGGVPISTYLNWYVNFDTTRGMFMDTSENKVIQGTGFLDAAGRPTPPEPPPCSLLLRPPPHRISSTAHSSSCSVMVWPVLLCIARLLKPLVRGFSREIVFGQPIPFSGVSGDVGPRLRASVLAEFKEANDAGRCHGKRLVLHSVDDGHIPATMPDKATELLAIPNMFAFIGFDGSATTAALLPTLIQHQIPDIALLTGSSSFRR